jgi:hypothetical protein
MIAYFILVHRYPEQFKRMFRAVYDPDNQYLIHVDKKAGKKLLKNIRQFLGSYANTSLLLSHNVVWGGYSMVDAELRGMKQLLKLNKSWNFFINLSGQDFPLQTQRTIKNFLCRHPGKNFILSADQSKNRPNTLNRIQNYFTETANGFSGFPIKRPFLKDTTAYIGGQWKILSRKACEFICTSPKVPKFKEYYKNTLIPDEGFFQTVLMNTGWEESIVNDDKRAIIWIPDIDSNIKSTRAQNTKFLVASGKIKLRPKTFIVSDLPFLISSKSFFARKFDETVDAEILKILESNLNIYNQGIKSTASENEVSRPVITP